MSMNHCARERATGRAVPSFLNFAGPSEDEHAPIIENIYWYSDIGHTAQNTRSSTLRSELYFITNSCVD